MNRIKMLTQSYKKERKKYVRVVGKGKEFIRKLKREKN